MDILGQAGSALTNGEKPVVVQTTNFAGTVEVNQVSSLSFQRRDYRLEVSANSNESAVSLELPSALDLSRGSGNGTLGEASMGLQVVLWKVNPFGSALQNTTQQSATAVSIQLCSDNGTAILLTNLTNPVVVNMTATPRQNASLSCKYYDEVALRWDSAGLRTVHDNTTWVVQCLAYHLTAFVVRGDDLPPMVPGVEILNPIDFSSYSRITASTRILWVLVTIHTVFLVWLCIARRKDAKASAKVGPLFSSPRGGSSGEDDPTASLMDRLRNLPPRLRAQVRSLVCIRGKTGKELMMDRKGLGSVRRSLWIRFKEEHIVASIFEEARKKEEFLSVEKVAIFWLGILVTMAVSALFSPNQNSGFAQTIVIGALSGLLIEPAASLFEALFTLGRRMQREDTEQPWKLGVRGGCWSQWGICARPLLCRGTTDVP